MDFIIPELGHLINFSHYDVGWLDSYNSFPHEVGQSSSFGKA